MFECVIELRECVLVCGVSVCECVIECVCGECV